MELVYLLVLIGVLIAIIYYALFIGPDETESNENEKEEKEVQKEERWIDKFNKLYIGQSLYNVQELLGTKCELQEERLLRDEKVIKKVYIWKITKWSDNAYIRCTFYEDKLTVKEQINLD